MLLLPRLPSSKNKTPTRDSFTYWTRGSNRFKMFGPTIEIVCGNLSYRRHLESININQQQTVFPWTTHKTNASMALNDRDSFLRVLEVLFSHTKKRVEKNYNPRKNGEFKGIALLPLDLSTKSKDWRELDEWRTTRRKPGNLKCPRESCVR